MKKPFKTLAGVVIAFLCASCNNDCDCTKIVVYYDSSGAIWNQETQEVRDDCGKQENFTEQDGDGKKEVAIICEFR